MHDHYMVVIYSYDGRIVCWVPIISEQNGNRVSCSHWKTCQVPFYILSTILIVAKQLFDHYMIVTLFAGCLSSVNKQTGRQSQLQSLVNMPDTILHSIRHFNSCKKVVWPLNDGRIVCWVPIISKQVDWEVELAVVIGKHGRYHFIIPSIILIVAKKLFDH